MQIYHHLMLWGGITAAASFVVGIVSFLAALGNDNERYGINCFIISIVCFFLWIVSSGLTIFGFIDYMRN